MLLLHTDEGRTPDRLQELQVNLLSNTDCQEAWGGSNIGRNHICASGVELMTGVCNVRSIHLIYLFIWLLYLIFFRLSYHEVITVSLILEKGEKMVSEQTSQV